MEDFTAAQSGEPDNLIVTVKGNMTIHYAAEMKESILNAFNESSKLTLNVEKVSEIDLAGLQLLCAAHKSSSVAGKQFDVVGLKAEAMQKVIATAGFSRHIGCTKDENISCLWVGGGK